MGPQEIDHHKGSKGDDAYKYDKTSTPRHQGFGSLGSSARRTAFRWFCNLTRKQIPKPAIVPINTVAMIFSGRLRRMLRSIQKIALNNVTAAVAIYHCCPLANLSSSNCAARSTLSRSLKLRPQLSLDGP